MSAGFFGGGATSTAAHTNGAELELELEPLRIRYQGESFSILGRSSDPLLTKFVFGLTIKFEKGCGLPNHLPSVLRNHRLRPR
jgi:hypothetical protein